MPSVGPQLPPHLVEKRKHDELDDGSDRQREGEPSFSPGSASKRKRIVGPLPPPAPLDERPPSSPVEPAQPRSNEEDDTSSDDDDFGPALPTSTNSQKSGANSIPEPSLPTDPAPSAPSQRDAWMLVPPSNGDRTARVDPTKLKARKFNTGKGASAPKDTSSNAADTWNETPQEKHARLQREMMGIKDPNSTTASSATSKPAAKRDAAQDGNDTETRKRMKEYAAARGPSLYDAHQTKQTVEKDDDPSARAFDREKDIGGGLQLNSTQRRDLLKKSGDFSSRFSSAKYL